VIGFEPQADALSQLSAKKGSQETYLPYAIGDGQSHTLHVCQASGMTSLLEPDPKSLQLFPDFTRWGAVKRTEPVTTKRLDDIAEITEMDLLKIDAQGAEMSVFRNGRARLSKAIAVHTEVSFIPLYKGQPTFSEIDVELRGLGFVPHTFAALNRRMIHPLRGASPREHLNQLLEADAVYVRDFRDMETMSIDQLGHLAMIAHHVYGSFDLALRCLIQLADRGVIQKPDIQKYGGVLRSIQSKTLPRRR